jgi:hypothetical protein
LHPICKNGSDPRRQIYGVGVEIVFLLVGFFNGERLPKTPNKILKFLWEMVVQ